MYSIDFHGFVLVAVGLVTLSVRIYAATACIDIVHNCMLATAFFQKENE
jgi:hypothetical protein